MPPCLTPRRKLSARAPRTGRAGRWPTKSGRRPKASRPAVRTRCLAASRAAVEAQTSSIVALSCKPRPQKRSQVARAVVGDFLCDISQEKQNRFRVSSFHVGVQGRVDCVAISAANQSHVPGRRRFLNVLLAAPPSERHTQLVHQGVLIILRGVHGRAPKLTR